MLSVLQLFLLSGIFAEFFQAGHKSLYLNTFSIILIHNSLGAGHDDAQVQSLLHRNV